MLPKVIKKTKMTIAGEIVETGDESDEVDDEDDLSADLECNSM